MSLSQRIEQLENRSHMQPPNEEGGRFWLAAQALRREEHNLLREYLRLIDRYPDQDRLAVADKGAPQQRQAHARLKELEQLPPGELERLAS